MVVANSIADKIGNSLADNDIAKGLRDQHPEIPDSLFTDDCDEENVEPYDPNTTAPEANNTTPEAYNEYDLYH